MIYTDENRGTIQFKERARQLIDFHNLRFGSITPTDSDGEIEYHDKAWIFIEIKYDGASISRGQKIAFERKVKDIAAGGKKAVLFVADHYVEDTTKDIDAALCIVRQFYYLGNWYDGDGSDLKAYVNRFIGMVDGMAA